MGGHEECQRLQKDADRQIAHHGERTVLADILDLGRLETHRRKLGYIKEVICPQMTVSLLIRGVDTGWVDLDLGTCRPDVRRVVVDDLRNKETEDILCSIY